MHPVSPGWLNIHTGTGGNVTPLLSVPHGDHIWEHTAKVCLKCPLVTEQLLTAYWDRPILTPEEQEQVKTGARWLHRVVNPYAYLNKLTTVGTAVSLTIIDTSQRPADPDVQDYLKDLYVLAGFMALHKLTVSLLQHTNPAQTLCWRFQAAHQALAIHQTTPWVQLRVLTDYTKDIECSACTHVAGICLCNPTLLLFSRKLARQFSSLFYSITLFFFAPDLYDLHLAEDSMGSPSFDGVGIALACTFT